MSTQTQSLYEKIDNAIIQSNSLVCVGLDPDISKMPLCLVNKDISDEEKVFTFLMQIIDITASHACAFKIQKAFYDQFDLGHALLKETVQYIKNNYPHIPVIIDCKIGDTDNTMLAYMHLLFEDIQADAVVVNPYMGDDVLEPFMQDQHKGAVVLVQTSNPRAQIVQEITSINNIPLWQEILHLTLNRWNVNNNLILVLSSNANLSNYEAIRQQIPQNVPILLAGIGLQGGNPIILKQLLNENNRGVFVNSSRGILYPYDRNNNNWHIEVLNAVVELKNMLNTIRNQ